jgi:hypothetical protein
MGLLDDAIREHLDLKRRRGADPAEIERAEREALGPVRREPMPGAATAVVSEEPVPAAASYEPEPEPVFEVEPLPDVGTDLGAEAAFETEDRHAPLADSASSSTEISQEEKRTPKRRSLLHRRRREEPEAEPESEVADIYVDHDDPFAETVSDEVFVEHEETAFSGERESYEHVHADFDDPPPALEIKPVLPPISDAEVDEAEFEAPPTEVHQAPRPVRATPPPPTKDELEAVDDVEAEEELIGGETVEYDVEKALAHDEVEEDDEILEETPEFLQDTPDHDRLWFEQKPPKDFDI